MKNTFHIDSKLTVFQTTKAESFPEVDIYEGCLIFIG